MDKLTAIKIKYDDGTYSDEIPISVLSENVEWDNTHTLVDVLGSIDVNAKGTIQAQIDKLSNNTQLTDVLGNIDVKADGTVQDQIKKLSNEKVSNIQLTDVLGNVDVSAKGTLQDQIDKLSNNDTQFDTHLASINDELNKIQEHNDSKLDAAISDFNKKGNTSISTFETNGNSAISTFNSNGNNAISTFNTKGDEAIAKLGAITVDTSMDASSTNPVQNKVVKSYVDTQDAETLSSAKSYADTQDATTLASAKSYADSLTFQKVITSGTSAPSGGSDGDIYIQY